MKICKIISLILGIGLCVGFWKVLEYRQFQEISYDQCVSETNRLRHHLKALQEDQAFLRDHQSEIEHLSAKKFFSPENRLIAGKSIEEVGKTLSAFQYTFEPERSVFLEGYTYKVTKIVIDIAALLDTEVYVFIENLLQDFPGILHLSEVNLVLNTESPPPYMKGKLAFEWYTMGEER